MSPGRVVGYRVMLAAALAIAGPSRVLAVAESPTEVCDPKTNPRCESSTSLCQYCDPDSGTCTRRDVEDPGDGQTGCRVVFNGTFSESCQLFGEYCEHITVTP